MIESLPHIFHMWNTPIDEGLPPNIHGTSWPVFVAAPVVVPVVGPVVEETCPPTLLLRPLGVRSKMIHAVTNMTTGARNIRETQDAEDHDM